MNAYQKTHFKKSCQNLVLEQDMFECVCMCGSESHLMRHYQYTRVNTNKKIENEL